MLYLCNACLSLQHSSFSQTRLLLLRKFTECFSSEIIRKLRKSQYWAENLSYRKVYAYQSLTFVLIENRGGRGKPGKPNSKGSAFSSQKTDH